MKHARKDMKVEGAVELPHVVAYLEQLVQALKAGTVRIRQDDEQIVLGPRGVVGFSLSARDRGRRQSLALELTWRKFSAPDPTLDLHIDAAPADTGADTDAATTEVTDADTDATEVTDTTSSAPADSSPAADARGEAHEGELHTADVYMHSPRGSNNRSDP
jgi:amphi-Trp domain-containing protein